VNPTPLFIDVVTIFPDMFRGALEHSIIARASAAGLVELRLHDLRKWADDKHRSVDDTPFGGGGGMVLKAAPLFAAVEEITGRPAGACPDDEAIVLLSPAGSRHGQPTARRYSKLKRLVLICGRYEGVDERVRTHLCTESLSIGDFVLSGGEPAAAVVIDSVVRLLPGALGNPEGADTESFEDGLLEAPHYTRPADFRGLDIPEVLTSGDHGAVRRWRRAASLRLTEAERPDLVERAREAGLLDAEDEKTLAETDPRAGEREATGLAPSR
jgi:tRNA (guanine37-N1)-methyltransferase